jgi:hypothetical protein
MGRSGAKVSPASAEASAALIEIEEMKYILLPWQSKLK